MVPTARLGEAHCSLHRRSYSRASGKDGRVLDPIHVAMGGKAQVMMTREQMRNVSNDLCEGRNAGGRGRLGPTAHWPDPCLSRQSHSHLQKPVTQ